MKFSYKPDELAEFTAGSSIRVGDMLALNASGQAVPMTNTANQLFIGVSNSSAEAGQSVEVLRQAQIVAVAHSGVTFTTADVGSIAYAESATTVGKTATGRTAVGRVMKVISPDKVWIATKNFTI